MIKSFTYRGKRIRPSQLKTAGETLDALSKDGGHWDAVFEQKEACEGLIGIDPIWRYPIADHEYHGAFLFPTSDGVLYVPYISLEEDDDLLLLQKACVLDMEALDTLREDFQSFSEGLLQSMADMSRAYRKK